MPEAPAAPRSENYGDRLFSHNLDSEAERLGALARALDPVTFHWLGRLPVQPARRRWSPQPAPGLRVGSGA
jgi:hypothetical protein